MASNQMLVSEIPGAGKILDSAPAETCLEFSRQHGTSTEPAIRDLAAFAYFTGKAIEADKANDVQSTQMYDALANRTYALLVLDGHGWRNTP